LELIYDNTPVKAQRIDTLLAEIRKGKLLNEPESGLS